MPLPETCDHPTQRPVPVPCKGCGAPILWTRNLKTGKACPLDAEPTDGGNIALMPAGAMYLSREQVELGQKLGTRRYTSHFATCPKARDFRKPKGT